MAAAPGAAPVLGGGALVSRYLEEAAALLRKAAEANEQENGKESFRRSALIEGRERIARQFAALAAIDSGQLPEGIARLILDRIGGER